MSLVILVDHPSSLQECIMSPYDNLHLLHYQSSTHQTKHIGKWERVILVTIQVELKDEGMVIPSVVNQIIQ